MNLIENIIDELTDSSKSLTDPLLETKVLASRIKNDELLNWADTELTGYKDKDIPIPDYRRGRPTFVCMLQQGWTREENIPLPLMIFKAEDRERLFIFTFDDSVKTLEAHGNTITTGSQNKVATKYKILKGNLDSLKDELKKNQVSDDDLSEIATIVQQEQPNIETGEFGEKTNKWLYKMYQKSLDGTWQVSIATAGGLLVELLKGYFGL